MEVPGDTGDTPGRPTIAKTIRQAGIAGAGGAGFPTYAKWRHLEATPYLAVNHQESEPNFYVDRWLGRTYATELADFFQTLCDNHLEVVALVAKDTDRQWLGALEAAADATVYGPADVPIDPASESGVLVVYTGDRYQYGMETVLLRLLAGIVLRENGPIDHGWLVQNTETMFNVMQAVRTGDPMGRKLVHVDGNVPSHRFFDVPIGTPAAVLIEAAGRPVADLDADEVLTEGGPGWCYELEGDPDAVGVRKRTNCLLVLDRDEVDDHTYGDGRINVLESRDWTGDHETRPTTLAPARVLVPLVSNPEEEHGITPSRPVVDDGAAVETGELIAVPADDGISNAQHASIDGTVASVTDSHVEILAGGSRDR